MRFTEETRLAACPLIPFCPPSATPPPAPGLSRRASPPAPRGRCGRGRRSAGGAGGGASPAVAAASAIANPEDALQQLGVYAGPARQCSPWR